MTGTAAPQALVDAVLGLLRTSLDASITCRCLVAVSLDGRVLLDVDLVGADAAVAATALVSAHLTPSGALNEVLWGRVEPGVPVTFDVRAAVEAQQASAPDGAAVFDAFRAALGDGPAAASRCFTPDGVFSHASFVAGGPRVLARGRRDIETALQARPPGPPRAELAAVGQVGRWVMIEGWGVSPQGRKPFVSSLTMDDAGLILRYTSVGVVALPLQ